MTSAIADSVMAVTHKLVRQAMHGQWQDVPKTVEERRVLLDRLNASASPSDQQWLLALRQAMAESDAAVAKIAAVDSPEAALAAGPEQGVHTVDATLEMIRHSR
ncbi:MAG TPA: hypothetical protein PKE27_07690 [Povalibacter sp.]|uniref:hypothetical protein n=1 Tax=Povalibacter sp. TaxID=1962978 RepID=UPI002C76DC8C|nr:hypothetical protein [Povalibacter sp.]HMN44436.1 hypothetical protein [Povalibacter sp.]